MHQSVSHEPGVLRGGSALRREMMDCRRCDTVAIGEFCFVAIGWCICCAWGVYAALKAGSARRPERVMGESVCCGRVGYGYKRDKNL